MEEINREINRGKYFKKIEDESGKISKKIGEKKNFHTFIWNAASIRELSKRLKNIFEIVIKSRERKPQNKSTSNMVWNLAVFIKQNRALHNPKYKSRN